MPIKHGQTIHPYGAIQSHTEASRWVLLWVLIRARVGVRAEAAGYLILDMGRHFNKGCKQFMVGRRAGGIQ